jgi:hypothetical protein
MFISPKTPLVNISLDFSTRSRAFSFTKTVTVNEGPRETPSHHCMRHSSFAELADQAQRPVPLGRPEIRTPSV